MTGPYPLALLTLTDEFEISLGRNTRFGVDLPYHSARVFIGRETIPECPYVGSSSYFEGDPSQESRWPVQSEGGYTFGPQDEYRRITERLWRHPDGQLYTQKDAPVGSCYEAPREWEHASAMASQEYEAHRETRGTYWIKLLCGTWWSPDWEASSGGGWTVTGTLPLISVTPSIAAPGYHGWVGVNGTAPGFLSADLDGRFL